jgi:hypothetical protein
MPTDLHTQLRVARGAHQQAEYALATLLFTLHRTRRYTERGHASVVSYGEAELDLTPRQTRDLVFVAKRRAALPALDEAFRTGRVGYTKAREVARIATPETDAAWTHRASETTNRALERQVAAAQRGDAPPPDPRACDSCCPPAKPSASGARTPPPSSMSSNACGPTSNTRPA